MRLRTTLLSSLCLAVTHAHLPAVIINGVDWSNAYQPNAATNNNPPTDATGVTGGPWTLVAANGTTSITDDYFTIATTTQANNRSYSNTSNWNGNSGMTVETRLQMVTALTPDAPIGQIRIGGTSSLTTNKYIYINFTQTSISYGTGTLTNIATGLDLTAFSTIRLVLSNDLTNANASALSIYVDNNLVSSLSGAAFTSGAAGTNNIIFGDITGTGTSAAGGTSNWNYIAYTQGLFPIPEPQSLALSGLAVLGWLYGRRMKRANRPVSA